MATGQIPRTTAAILRRLQLLDSPATKIADRGEVAQSLSGLSGSPTGNRRGVPLFLVKFPDDPPEGGA